MAADTSSPGRLEEGCLFGGCFSGMLDIERVHLKWWLVMDGALLVFPGMSFPS